MTEFIRGWFTNSWIIKLEKIQFEHKSFALRKLQDSELKWNAKLFIYEMHLQAYN